MFFAGSLSPNLAKNTLRLPPSFHVSFNNGSLTWQERLTATVKTVEAVRGLYHNDSPQPPKSQSSSEPVFTDTIAPAEKAYPVLDFANSRGTIRVCSLADLRSGKLALIHAARASRWALLALSGK